MWPVTRISSNVSASAAKNSILYGSSTPGGSLGRFLVGNDFTMCAKRRLRFGADCPGAGWRCETNRSCCFLRTEDWIIWARPLRGRSGGGSAPRCASPGIFLAKRCKCGPARQGSGGWYGVGVCLTDPSEKVAGPPLGKVSSPSTGCPCTLRVVFGVSAAFLHGFVVQKGADTTFVDVGKMLRWSCQSVIAARVAWFRATGPSGVLADRRSGLRPRG
jgi:hypothetical protein